MINKIEIKAPAKINIGLYVTEKRDDGFHNLETIFYPIKDLFDEVFIEKSESFSFTCSDSSLPTDENNLVVKAHRLMEIESKKKIPVKVHLEKKIPSGAGMGGGSSDAAAVMISLNDMFNLKVNYKRLLELALELGSDVPFFIKTFPSIGKGRGEILTPVELEINKYIAIVNPQIHISTKEAYSNVSPKKIGLNWNDIVQKLNTNPKELNSILINDFEEYAFKTYPKISELKNNMLEAGAEYALMTGSGSTVFGIFSDKKSAEEYLKTADENYVKFLSDPENQY